MEADAVTQKMEVDLSATVDERIPYFEQKAKKGKLDKAIEGLLTLEKQTRTAADMHSTAKILIAIVKMCFELKEWEKLNENCQLLSKRRGQLKQAVTKMVQEAYGYIDQTPDKPTRVALIETLRSVTEGKIYVEVERARLTRQLAAIKEEEGKIKQASKILQELQVETFGSMEKKEKVEFILEQMRLCATTEDFVRMQIISKKVNIKYFEGENTEEAKLKYYKLMIELAEHDGSYLKMCTHFRALYNTPNIRDHAQHGEETLTNVVLCLVLAAYDNEQSDLIHRVKEEKKLRDMSVYRDLIKLFTTPEIMDWERVCSTYESTLRQTAFFCHATYGEKRWKELKVRVVEHNIRVMAKYYTRVTMARMAHLLGLTEEETEEFLSKLVVNHTVEAKIDRQRGVIQFTSSKNPSELLNDWSHSLQSLMNLVNKTTHLITKEQMVHKLA